jgi:hypothetical protein
MLLRWICGLLSPLLPLCKQPSVIWTVTFEESLTFHIRGKFLMQLNTEQKVKATVRPLTAGGNPARIDGPVHFESQYEDIVLVEAIDDTTCYLIARGPGTARITATFDADLDADEVRSLQFDAEITVVEAEAEGASLDFAQPEFLVLTPVGEDEVVELPVEDEDEVETSTEADDPAPVDATASDTAEGDADTSETPAP